MTNEHSFPIDKAKRAAIFAYNWVRGYRFFWVADGHPSGGYFDMTEKTCPYPVLNDWSVRACVRAGHCGCSKGSVVIDGGYDK